MFTTLSKLITNFFKSHSERQEIIWSATARGVWPYRFPVGQGQTSGHCLLGHLQGLWSSNSSQNTLCAATTRFSQQLTGSVWFLPSQAFSEGNCINCVFEGTNNFRSTSRLNFRPYAVSLVCEFVAWAESLPLPLTLTLLKPSLLKKIHRCCRLTWGTSSPRLPLLARPLMNPNVKCNG